ncbi:MAG: hypothetical protein FJ091_06570 [Deltaproteobacteria bacterium]|nr:hypothetical protein [Deltaproteobacteria bacterium]
MSAGLDAGVASELAPQPPRASFCHDSAIEGPEPPATAAESTPPPAS